jgi:hypothetical protein
MDGCSSRSRTAWLVASSLLFFGATVADARDARAETNVDFGFEVMNDIRFNVDRDFQAVPDDDGVGSKVVEGRPGRFSRNEASARFQLRVAPVPQVRFVGDIEVVWLNRSDSELSLADLTSRSSIDPFRLELDAAYVDLRDVLPGLDIRVGRQIVQWGSADMFNPTNNLNADDLEDRAVFREPIANEMIRVDYTYMPERDGWLSEVIFTLVWVPVFRPMQLPVSAVIALADSSAPIPIVEEDIAASIQAQREPMANLLEDPDVRAEQPELSLANSQIGLRIQTRMINTDFSLSYYRGFDDTPVMSRADTVFTEQGTIGSDITLTYPRMQAFGFDINGQIPWLDDLGFWIEGAVIFPERVGMVFSLPIGGGTEINGTAVEDRPFLKLTVGIDYSFNENAMLIVQYVRGMVNQFGAHTLSDILVVGLDLKFWSDRILLRLFSLVTLDWMACDRGDDACWDAGLSANIFPMLRINPWGSIELDVGAIVPIGHESSFFGQPATGATEVFLRARAAF